jgi:hypothetical protein
MHRRNAWTSLETLLAGAILAALAGLALLAVSALRSSAWPVVCDNNLRQLAVATHMHSDCKGALPPYSAAPPRTGNWWFHLLPFVEQQNLFGELAFSVGSGNQGMQGTPITEVRFALLTCPLDFSAPGAVSTTSYLANWYVLGDATAGCSGRPQTLHGITDGAAQTVAFAEGYARCAGIARPALVSCAYHNFGITWDEKPSDDALYFPDDYTLFQVAPAPGGPGGCHPWRTQTVHAAMPVAMADGRVRAIQANIDPVVWKQLLKPRDGLPLAFD